MLDSISGPYTIDYRDPLVLESSYVLQALRRTGTSLHAGCNITRDISAYSSESEIVSTLTSDNSSVIAQTTWGAVIFSSTFPSDTSLPNNIQYKIRLRSDWWPDQEEWFTEIMFPEFQYPGPREKKEDTGGIPSK